MKVKTKERITVTFTRYKILAYLDTSKSLREFFYFTYYYDGTLFKTVISKCDLQTSSITVLWAFVRDASS